MTTDPATTYPHMEDSESGTVLHIIDDCAPPEAALAIAEAFTRLAKEPPEAPTE